MIRPIPAAALGAALLVWLGAALAARADAQACARPVMACPMVAQLLAQREGYGRAAAGGLGGVFAVVTSDADSGPGTLREALKAARQGPTWITFADDMTIDLRSKLLIPSNVTIDGRGRRIVLHDYGLDARGGVSSVIVTHLVIDGRFRTEEVAFNIFGGARDIWADHLDLSRFIDRLINVKTGAGEVTLSWIRFHDHNKVMLLNNLTDENLFAFWERDSPSRVTVHHCWFVDTVQRNPRAVLGRYDLYDNLLEDWDFYGMSFGLEARAWIAGNIFVNRARRPCVEPPFFDTIEHVRENYCAQIARAPATTALANGDADKAAYFQTRERYGYQHDYRAFLRLADNLYLGDARAVLKDFRPEAVAAPDYCTSYRHPDLALADRIRREAGDSQAQGDAPDVCPPGLKIQ